jgi:uncharacterized protein (DUF2384 family)
MVLTVTTISVDDLTELIGIDVDTASGLIAAVREELPFDVFVNLQHVLDIPAAPLADLLGMPLRTLNRRKHEGQPQSSSCSSQVRDRHPAHFRATARGRFPTSTIGIITIAKL